jgi:nucleoside-diphosphate-sugar epimerase
MATTFFTGFPGFLGSELLPRVLLRGEDVAVCLVQPKFRAMAEERARKIVAENPSLAGRITMVEGDLTEPLTHVDAGAIREIYHFAAIYDLSVPREIAMRVNVTGTERILDLAERSPRLERLHYVSTCYVSGRHYGAFHEHDLEGPRQFNNFYEETKYLAEVAVRQRMSKIPATVYRPSVVVGDSRTGVTQKYDGPYFVMQWLMRQPKLAVLPVVGNPSHFTFNVVPRDFVIAAMTELSARKDNVGVTYALADPNPLTVDETIRTIADATGRKVLRIPMTKGMAKGALDHVPGVYRLMRIPSSAVDYFVHPTTYTTHVASRHLGDSGIKAPSLREYVDKLVAFMREHPEIGSQAMA